jgi:hypothetical protein
MNEQCTNGLTLYVNLKKTSDAMLLTLASCNTRQTVMPVEEIVKSDVHHG